MGEPAEALVLTPKRKPPTPEGATALTNSPRSPEPTRGAAEEHQHEASTQRDLSLGGSLVNGSRSLGPRQGGVLAPPQPAARPTAPSSERDLFCNDCVNSSPQNQHTQLPSDPNPSSPHSPNIANSLERKRTTLSQFPSPAQNPSDVQEERKRALLRSHELSLQKEAAAISAFERKRQQEHALRSHLDSQVREREHMFDDALGVQHPLGGALEGCWNNDSDGDKRVRS